jgi:hypothetical protein
MGRGIDDKGTYNRTTRALPKQPSRCTGIMTFYDQRDFSAFLKQVKKVIRTCVEDGRENELLDNNSSLASAWNELQQQPVSMNLAKGKNQFPGPTEKNACAAYPPISAAGHPR